MNEFDCDYYENGVVTGKSCYLNYRWMPEMTIRMAYLIIKHLNLKTEESVLDFGCAKGYLVKALRILDIPAYGCDISEYAINQVDGDVRSFCNFIEDSNCLFPFERKFDWIISKDVLEHLSEQEIDAFLTQAQGTTEKMFHVIPLGDGEKFVVPEYQLDKTHKLAKTKEWWLEKFESFGWSMDVFSYNMKGIKDNWTGKYPFGNGFFILKRKIA